MSEANFLVHENVEGNSAECMRAVMDEIAGRSRWWHPYLLLRHRPATPREGPGCAVDVIANPRGHTERLWGTTRWAMRLDAMDAQARRLHWTFIEGHYRGWMIWDLRDMASGSTRITVRGELHPAGWNRVRSLVWDEFDEVTRILRSGFVGMSAYIREQRAGSAEVEGKAA